ncbi:hypothetical protein VT03_23750 [Planctomyces sp. SH-PL14]|nr:hypothetical protein VT03_23750 [Planctomyces sp. SH-PL14]
MKRPRDVRLKHGGRWILSPLCAAVFCVLSADAHAQDPVRLYVDGVLDDDNGAGIAGRSFLVLAADALREVSPSQWQPNAVEASDVSLALLYGGQFMMAGRDDSVRTPEAAEQMKPRATWFLGFMEGRTRVAVPRWWKDALLSIEAPETAKQGHGVSFRDLEDIISRQQKLAVEEAPKGTFRLKCDAREISISDHVLEPTGISMAGSLGFGDTIAATLADDTLWLAVSSDSSCSLVSVDLGENQVHWHRKAWMAVPTPAGSSGMGVGPGWVSLVRAKNEIAVFGGNHDGLYANSFDATTGVPRWRFFTGRLGMN